MTGDRTLTMTQAAQVARIAWQNLQRWIMAGKLKATKPDGRHWAIQESDLLEALREYPPTFGGARNRGKARPGVRPGCRRTARPDDGQRGAADGSPVSTDVF